MELLQLTYFCDAAITENFSHTAEKFNVPASNISQTVKRLERELGVQLFRRTSNKITLSEEGKIFYEGARRALDALSDAKRRITDADGGGEIKLLIQTCRRIVTAAIEKYRKAFPGVSISINHIHSEGDLDYDFIISDGVDTPSDYNGEFLISENLLLAARGDSEVSARRVCSLSELRDERFIVLEGSRLYRYTESLCLEEGFVPNAVIRTDDPYYVRKYVEMGLGVSFVPSVSWRGMFSDDVTLLNVGSYKRDTMLFVRKDKRFTESESAFRDVLISAFRNEATKKNKELQI